MKRVVETGLAEPSAPFSWATLGHGILFTALVPFDDSGTLVPGDVQVQTAQCLRNLRRTIGAAGGSMADVTQVVVLLTDLDDFAAMNEAYRKYFPTDPPARATVKAALTSPDFKVEITLLAVKSAGRRVFTTPKADGSPGQPSPNLSSAVRVGDRLYLAGMLGNTEANRGDARAQARETFARVGRTLSAAGFAWPDVVDGVVYLTDARDFPALNEAYREVFTRGFPTRATVLTGLVAPDGLLEIMLVASK